MTETQARTKKELSTFLICHSIGTLDIDLIWRDMPQETTRNINNDDIRRVLLELSNNTSTLETLLHLPRKLIYHSHFSRLELLLQLGLYKVIRSEYSEISTNLWLANPLLFSDENILKNPSFICNYGATKMSWYLIEKFTADPSNEFNNVLYGTLKSATTLAWANFESFCTNLCIILFEHLEKQGDVTLKNSKKRFSTKSLSGIINTFKQSIHDERFHQGLDKIADFLRNLEQSRHVIVHGGGIVDASFLEKNPKSTAIQGKPIDLSFWSTHMEANISISIACKLALDIDCFIGNKTIPGYCLIY
jgi:hypothetical protein